MTESEIRPISTSNPLQSGMLQPLDFRRALIPRAASVGEAPALLLQSAFGAGYISDVVEKKEEGDTAAIPVSRRVVLLLEPRLQVVASTWSDAITGVYRFDGLSLQARFTVMAVDHLGRWRAVIASGLSAKVRP